MEEKIKNILRGLLTGLLAAPFVTLFANLVTLANEINARYRFLILLLPLGAILIVMIYDKVGNSSKNIVGRAIRTIHNSEDGMRGLYAEDEIKVKEAGAGFFSSVLSHLLGASVGKEGIGVQIGLASASLLSKAEERMLKTTRSDYYLMSGAAAAFSALFGAPVAGTLFGTQLASPRLSRFDAFLPTVASSYSSYFLSRALHIHLIAIPSFKCLEVSIENALIVFFFAIVIGLVCSISCRLLEFFKEKLNTLYPGNARIKALIPATMILALSFIVYFITGGFRYNGLSTDLLRVSMFRAVDFSDFLIKLLMVLLSLAAGFQGGEVVPLLVLGGTLGSTLATLFSLDASAFTVLSAIGFLNAGIKLPLVTFALGIELFGYSEPALLFLMTSVSFIASGKVGIYSHQRIY